MNYRSGYQFFPCIIIILIIQLKLFIFSLVAFVDVLYQKNAKPTIWINDKGCFYFFSWNYDKDFSLLRPLNGRSFLQNIFGIKILISLLINDVIDPLTTLISTIYFVNHFSNSIQKRQLYDCRYTIPLLRVLLHSTLSKWFFFFLVKD